MMPVALASLPQPAPVPQAAVSRTLKLCQVPGHFRPESMRQLLQSAGVLTNFQVTLGQPNGIYTVSAEFADEVSSQKAFVLLNSPDVRRMIQGSASASAPAPVAPQAVPSGAAPAPTVNTALPPAMVPTVTPAAAPAVLPANGLNEDPFTVEVAGLTPEMNESTLIQYFQPFGQITLCHVLRDAQGHPTVAFIRFSDAGAAARAISVLNNCSVYAPTGQLLSYLQCKLAQCAINVPAPMSPASSTASQSRAPSPASGLSSSSSSSNLDSSSRSSSTPINVVPCSFHDLGLDSGSESPSPVSSSPSLSPREPQPQVALSPLAPLPMPMAAVPASPAVSAAPAVAAAPAANLVYVPHPRAAPVFFQAMPPMVPPMQPIPAVVPAQFPHLAADVAPAMLFQITPAGYVQRQKRTFPPGHAIHKPVAADFGEGPIRGIGLFIFHLPLEATEQSIKELFEQVAGVKIIRATLMKDPNTKWNRGYGFVNVETQEEADRLIRMMTGYCWCGKKLKVQLKKNNRQNNNNTQTQQQGQ